MSRSRRPPPRQEGRDAARAGKAARPDEQALRIALAQLPGRMRRTIRLFHDVTGLTAVTSIRGPADNHAGPGPIAPPVHPRCASVLRKTTRDVPCEEEWQKHLRKGLRSRAVQSHVCPLGLRCSCVPIFLGETLVGIAKLVAGPETTARRISLAVRTLELAVSRPCQDFYVSTLSDELTALRRQVAELHAVRRREGSGSRVAAPMVRARDNFVVGKILDYLDGHYLDPDLSLAGVSLALGANDKYLTHLFTRVVGQRMHAYVVDLRLRRACRELSATETPIKRIAYESGFRQPDRFRHAFRRHAGVSPSAYRRIFGQV